MKVKSFQRALLLASGLSAVLVILLSHSFYTTASFSEKTKTEKSADHKEVAIHAPSDVATQGQSVELNEQQQPALLEELISPEDHQEKVVFIQGIATDFFKTLFRVIISPNAP